MKRHYFIGQFNLNDQIIECLDTETVHQIKDVLKINLGEEVVLCDGKGRAVIATLKQISKLNAEFTVVKQLPQKKDSKKIILFAAILKRDSFEWLLQKAVEVGVDEIVPVISERTVKIGSNEKRWQKIIKEAAEQSERQILPLLRSTKSFKDALNIKSGSILFFDPSGKTLVGLTVKDVDMSVFIGPEGGWSDNEIKMAKDAGAKVVNLGEGILRGETAGIVAVYLAKNII